MNDDELMRAAGRLPTEAQPQRDLWAGIAEAIQPARSRRTWLPAQAAAVVLLMAASSAVTYVSVKDGAPVAVIASTDMVFEQASFGGRYSLGPGFQDARDALLTDLDVELQRLPLDSQQNIKANLRLVEGAILDLNRALEEYPENSQLQDRLLRSYREELALLRRVSALSRNVSVRNDF